MSMAIPNKYAVFSSEAYNEIAIKFAASDAERFQYFPIYWGKFADGTDNIKIEGFNPRNQIAGRHCLFFASFHNNDVTFSQFSVFVVLLQSFIESLTIVLPFYPVGTMERVIEEGQVATANTYAILLSNLPFCGKPTRLMIYDIHTLQNRFYFHHTIISSLHTAIPLLIDKIRSSNDFNIINTVAFPDEGAAKRFGGMFRSLGFDVITCGKTRVGNRRIVTIQDGDCKDKHLVIVDDLVQTGGTLYECGKALKSAGAITVIAFVSHGVFPNNCFADFLPDGKKGDIFDKFFVTNSIPLTTRNIPKDNIFEVLDLSPQILKDLDL